MKLTTIAIICIMATAAPVFAEEPEEAEFITYKINIDKDDNFEQELQENKELFERLKNKNLFANWTKEGNKIPQNAKDAFKKPSFDDNVEVNKEETDYIRCVKGTTTK